MSKVQFVSQRTVATSTSSTSQAMPANVVPGDFVLAYIQSTQELTTTPDGWNRILSRNYAAGAWSTLVTRVVEENEPANYTWTFASLSGNRFHFSAWRNVDVNDPFGFLRRDGVASVFELYDEYAPVYRQGSHALYFVSSSSAGVTFTPSDWTTQLSSQTTTATVLVHEYESSTPEWLPPWGVEVGGTTARNVIITTVVLQPEAEDAQLLERPILEYRVRSHGWSDPPNINISGGLFGPREEQYLIACVHSYNNALLAPDGWETLLPLTPHPDTNIWVLIVGKEWDEDDGTSVTFPVSGGGNTQAFNVTVEAFRGIDLQNPVSNLFVHHNTSVFTHVFPTPDIPEGLVRYFAALDRSVHINRIFEANMTSRGRVQRMSVARAILEHEGGILEEATYLTDDSFGSGDESTNVVFTINEAPIEPEHYDFENDEPDAPPSGTENRWHGILTNWLVRLQPSPIGARVLRFSGTITKPCYLALLRVGVRKNVTVQATVRSAIITGTRSGIIVRASGPSDSENGYVAAFVNGVGTLFKLVNGTKTPLATNIGSNLTPDVWRRWTIRVVGNLIKVRQRPIEDPVEPEDPEDWDEVIEDPDVPNSGESGPYTEDNDDDQDWGDIGVGDPDDVPPTSPSSGQPWSNRPSRMPLLLGIQSRRRS